MSLVALSGAYGAGGSRIGPALAARLDVPFLDRAIPAGVAEELAVPFEDAEAHDERMSASWLERMLSGFVWHDVAAAAAIPSPESSAADFARATEAVLLRQAATGRGVILGRGAAILLREDPRVLRVRLDGPRERRVRQAMAVEGIDESSARERLRRLDRTHEAYVRHFYGVDICDPRSYHLVLDSTSIPIDTCVEILVAAARAIAPAAPAAQPRLSNTSL
jgi:cytidylate kinase